MQAQEGILALSLLQMQVHWPAFTSRTMLMLYMHADTPVGHVMPAFCVVMLLLLHPPNRLLPAVVRTTMRGHQRSAEHI